MSDNTPIPNHTPNTSNTLNTDNARATPPQAAPADILQRLSPILRNTKDAAHFLYALTFTPYAQISRAQSQDLSPIWNAISNLPPAVTPPLNANELARLFKEIARYQNITQLQRPVILPYGILLKKHFRTLYNTSVFSPYTPYICQITDPDLGKTELFENYTYSFNFMTLTNPDTRQLVSFPLIWLDPRILDATLNHNGQNIVSAFQNCIAATNHDYLHAAIGPIIKLYQPSHNNVMHHTTYMKAMMEHRDFINLNEHPIANLYHKHKFSLKSLPIKARHYTSTDLLIESHALTAHKQLAATLDHTQTLADLGVFFASLESLNQNIAQLQTQIPPVSASTITQYFVMALYERMLHAFPYTHPVIQYIEKRTAQLPISNLAWQKLVRLQETRENAPKSMGYSRTASKKFRRFALPAKHKNIKFLADLPRPLLIRAANHLHNMDYLTRLHYAPKKSGEKRALPDLQTLLHTVRDGLRTSRRYERIAKITKHRNLTPT